jgi:L,D-transpeptidase ErfK/SrfK
MPTAPLLHASRRLGLPLVSLALLAVGAACGITRPVPEPGRFRGQRADAAQAKDTRLLLRLGERRLYLMHGDHDTPVESFPIAVGKNGWETPLGRFRVEEMVVDPEFLKLDPSAPSRVLKRIPPGPANPLGERWIGFAHGEGWTVGIHGTPNPELLGQAVSHGCVRMRNADVVRVYERVELGTTVVVEP